MNRWPYVVPAEIASIAGNTNKIRRVQNRRQFALMTGLLGSSRMQWHSRWGARIQVVTDHEEFNEGLRSKLPAIRSEARIFDPGENWAIRCQLRRHCLLALQYWWPSSIRC